MKQYIFSLLIVLTGLTHAEPVLIFTYSYNRPDFIEIQYKTFKKFLKDDYEFIVFNDARESTMEERINAMCRKYGIHCIRIPQSIHNKPYLQRWPGESFNAPAVRNSNVVMYSLDQVGFVHKGIVALLDSDMFLIKDFSIKEEYMKNYNLAGLEQQRGTISYLWIGLAFLDMNTMPNHRSINFNCGRVGNTPVDAGGQTYNYLHDNPDVKIKLFDANFIHNFHYVLNETKITSLTVDLNAQGHYSFNDKPRTHAKAKPVLEPCT